MFYILRHALLILISLLEGVHTFGGKDHDDVQSDCTNRFEFRHQLRTLNCTRVIELNPTCGRNFSISYAEHPPYVFRGDDGEVEGILPAMIKYALDSCCFGCSNVHFLGPFTYIDKFYKNSSLIIPIQTSLITKDYFGHDYIYMFEVKSVSFIGPMPKVDSEKMIKVILKAVVSTWPILLTTLFMAITAGVVIWAIESQSNPEKFPISFVHGPFEGFWFAVVSMTTVGYGDRTPRTLCGRLFAMFWIICGIITFSMFAAKLNSALTAAVIDSQKVTLYKKNFAVLNTTSVGIVAAMKQGSSHTPFNSIEAIKEAIAGKKVDGAALDENIVNYFFSHIEDGEMELEVFGRIPTSKSSYGMLSFNRDFTKLFRSFFESNDDQRDIMAMLGMSKNHDHMFDNSLEMHKNEITEIYFSPSLLSATLISLAIGTIVVLLAGIACRRFGIFTCGKNVTTNHLNQSGKPNSKIPEEIKMVI